jgi:hypothetical protein
MWRSCASLQQARPTFEWMLLGRAVATSGWPPNVRVVAGASSIELFDTVAGCAFVAILPAAGSLHLTARLTGALPLACAAGTPIVALRAFSDVYGLHDGIDVDNGAEAATRVNATSDADYDVMLARLVASRAAVAAKNAVTLDRMTLPPPP